MQLVLDNGALGTVAATRFASGHLNDLRLRIYGDKGGLEVTYENNVSGLRACLEPDLQTATWHAVEAPVLATIYERFIAAIRGEGAGGAGLCPRCHTATVAGPGRTIGGAGRLEPDGLRGFLASDWGVPSGAPLFWAGSGRLACPSSRGWAWPSVACKSNLRFATRHLYAENEIC